MSFNKIKWILGISVVFLLILLTNLIDRQNFDKVNSSITSIYEDRLVAKKLVYELSQIAWNKELAIATNDTDYYAQELSADVNSIDTLIEQFKKTKLVTQEEKTLKRLESSFDELNRLEQQKSSTSDPGQLNKLDERLRSKIDAIQKNLYTLSNIQLDEGKRQMLQGKAAADSVELLTTMEIYLLVALALIIQIIILYNPGNKSSS